jgi:titin
MQEKSGMKLKSAFIVLLLLAGTFLIIPSGTVSAAQEGPYVYVIGGTPAVATITDYVGPGGAVVIPSTLGGYPTAIIDDDAFSWTTSLISVVIPNSTQSIGYASFYRCTSMTSVTIGTGVTTIAYGAFYACSSLTSITFLGLTAPTTVGGDWIAYTPIGIRGHSYAASNFPPPEANFSGLIMGAVVPAPPSIPDAPVNLRATGEAGFILLNWIAPTNLGNPSLTRYDLYRGTSSGIYQGPIGNSPAGTLTYNDITATPGIQYFYILRAINSVGPSPPSNQAIGIASSPPTVPSAPLNITVSAGAGYVRLTWAPPDSDGNMAITNYSVYRGPSSGGETLFVTIGNVLTYVNNGLANGQIYWYQVSAVNGVGEGARSGEVSAMPETVPTAPRDLQAVALNLGVDLSWTVPQYAGPGTLIYHLFRDASPIWNGMVLNYHDSAVSKGLTYSYWVAASNAIGWGENCTAVQATPFGPPSDPGDLTSIPGNGFIDLLWASPLYIGPGILTYHLFRDGAEIWYGTAASHRDIPLTKGAVHSYTVSASNVAGWGPNSSAVVSAALGVPDAPIGLSVTEGDGWVDLNWTAPDYVGPGILIYHLFRDGSEVWSGRATGYTDTSVVNDITYSYNVTASNSIGWGDSTPNLQATPQLGDTVPARPQGLAATPGELSVDLNWTAPSYLGPGTISYRLFRDGSEIWSGIATTYRDSPLTKGVQHSYMVAAHNVLGWGPNCSAVLATPFGVPDAPWGLMAIAGDDQVSLSWSAVNYSGPGTLLYHIFRDDILTWSGSETFHTDATVSNGISYVYHVAASNSVGWGLNSTPIQASPFGPPTVTFGLTASPGKGNVTLNWSAPSYVGPNPLYHVFRDASSVPVWSGPEHTWIDEGLLKGIVHHYKVAASNDFGWGPNSSEISANPFGPPDQPTGLQVASGIQQILLNWTAPSYVGPGSIVYHLFRDDALIWSGIEIAHNDVGLVIERNYIYKVAASNNVGWSSNSSAAEAVPFIPRVPFSPQHLQLTAGNASVTIFWGPPLSNGTSPLTGYKIYKGTNSSALALLTLVASVNSFEDSAVLNGQTYYYRVCAVNSVGDSPSTEILNATPQAQIVPPTPDNSAMMLVALGVLVVGCAAAVLILRKRR